MGRIKSSAVNVRETAMMMLDVKPDSNASRGELMLITKYLDVKAHLLMAWTTASRTF
jgi:hypothetical protein